MKYYLHVNYYEGPGKLEGLFELAKNNSYDGVELRYKYAFSDMSQEEYQAKVIELQKKHSLEVSFGGCVDFMLDDDSAVQRNLEQYLSFMEWAVEKLNTHSFNFFTGNLIRPEAAYFDFDRNGSGIAEEEHYEKAAEGLKKVGAKAAELRARIALETHNCYLHDLPKPCAKLLSKVNLDNVGVNYDHGNIFINKNGSSIEEVFNIIGDEILYVHLKNIFSPHDKSFFLSTRLEEGHIDTMDIMKRLKTRGFDGVVCTEYACTGDGVIAAKRDSDYLKFIRNHLGC